MTGWARTSLGGSRLAVDPCVGAIRTLEFTVGDRLLAPLHTAHWVGDPALPAGLAPVERNLAGDFLCAPFGPADVDGAPLHGWPCNSPWSVIDAAPGTLRMALDRAVMGARVEKRLALVPAAPMLVQEHVFTGGAGDITVAHHPMLRVRGRARLSCAPKRCALADHAPQEPGRNRLAVGEGVRAADLTAYPGADGGVVDLTRLPIAHSCEDFTTLVEAEPSGLGWTAVTREVEDDIVFFLKDRATLPTTFLWHSNAGRDFSPWGGWHDRVLGVEDGRAAGCAGHAYALGPNHVAREGVPTAFALGGEVRIRHAIGAVPRPQGWDRVHDVRAEHGQLRLVGPDGHSVELAVDAAALLGL